MQEGKQNTEKVNLGVGMQLGGRQLEWAKNSDSSWNKEFSNWFNGSILKDEKGNPLILYHGTFDRSLEQNLRPFNKFDSKHISQIGFHFGSVDDANDIVNKNFGKDHRIFPVVISMKNPLRIDDLNHFGSNSETIQMKQRDFLIKNYCGIEYNHKNPSECQKFVMEKWWSLVGDISKIQEENEIDDEEMDSMMEECLLPFTLCGEDYAKLLLELGYDGIIYKNKYENEIGSDSVIAIKPGQVRSAVTGESLWDN
jgi:hypothetical protein